MIPLLDVMNDFNWQDIKLKLLDFLDEKNWRFAHPKSDKGSNKCAAP